MNKHLISICLLVCLILSGCKLTAFASYEPTGIPLEVSVNSNGEISFSVKGEVSIPTPLGVFSIGVVTNPADYFRVSNVLTVRIDCESEYFYDLHGADFDLTFKSGYYQEISLQKVGTNLYLDIRSKDVSCPPLIVRATPTSQPSSTLSPSMSSQLDELVKNQDFYLAASLARTILSEDPNNEQVKNLLQAIAGYIPGGFAVSSGVYYPFNSAESITFVSGLHGDLAQVSPDGQRGLIINGENHDQYSIINFSDGSFVKMDEGIPSTDLTRVELLDMTSGIYFTPTKIKNIYNGSIQEIDCSAYTSSDTWSQNSRFIISGDLIVDTQSGSCRKINIPGLSGTVLVDEEKMWIVLWGDFTSMEQGQLFTANIDGSGLKKITDLPIHGRDWHDARTFLAPDSSAIYLSEGFLVSTRTGQVVNAIPNAIGWLETNPTTSNVRQARLTIQPKSGSRGTRFSFSLDGGEPGMEVVMRIDPGDNAGLPLYFVDDNGRIVDDPNYSFGMNTDINTSAGTYTVTIFAYPDQRPIAVATFTVTEP
jgi:hypothetical protein